MGWSKMLKENIIKERFQELRIIVTSSLVCNPLQNSKSEFRACPCRPQRSSFCSIGITFLCYSKAFSVDSVSRGLGILAM